MITIERVLAVDVRPGDAVVIAHRPALVTDVRFYESDYIVIDFLRDDGGHGQHYIMRTVPLERVPSHVEYRNAITV